jgi:hypothetical protein
MPHLFQKHAQDVLLVRRRKPPPIEEDRMVRGSVGRAGPAQHAGSNKAAGGDLTEPPLLPMMDDALGSVGVDAAAKRAPKDVQSVVPPCEVRKFALEGLPMQAKRSAGRPKHIAQNRLCHAPLHNLFSVERSNQTVEFVNPERIRIIASWADLAS